MKLFESPVIRREYKWQCRVLEHLRVIRLYLGILVFLALLPALLAVGYVAIALVVFLFLNGGHQ
jgi:hypothetical protein